MLSFILCYNIAYCVETILPAKIGHAEWEKAVQISHHLTQAIKKRGSEEANGELLTTLFKSEELLQSIIGEKTYGIGFVTSEDGFKLRTMYGSNVYGKTLDVSIDPRGLMKSPVRIMPAMLRPGVGVYTHFTEEVWSRIMSFDEWSYPFTPTGYMTPVRHHMLQYVESEAGCRHRKDYQGHIEEMEKIGKVYLPVVPHKARCGDDSRWLVDFSVVEHIEGQDRILIMHPKFIYDGKKWLLETKNATPPEWMLREISSECGEDQCPAAGFH